MARFRINDVHSVENTPTSPGTLRGKLGEMIVSSTACRAKVEAINPETGEYRQKMGGDVMQMMSTMKPKTLVSMKARNATGTRKSNPPMMVVVMIRTPLTFFNIVSLCFMNSINSSSIANHLVVIKRYKTPEM